MAEITGKILVERARALVPDLRARGQAAEESERIPEETIEDVRNAGLFQAVVPKRYGGYEIEYKYIPQIFRELGRGCTSTSWTLGFLIYHNFQFAHFPKCGLCKVSICGFASNSKSSLCSAHGKPLTTVFVTHWAQP